MKRLLFAIISIAILSGCGSDTSSTKETNVTKESNVTVQLQDINITNNPTNNVDVNNTNEIDIEINITALESGYYGDGTFINPFIMMNANYLVSKGEQWFMTPTLNQNCTIRMRTKVYITDIHVEDAELLPVYTNHITTSVLAFDVNSSYAIMDFVAQQEGYITIVSECLDTPKLYNLGE